MTFARGRKGVDTQRTTPDTRGRGWWDLNGSSTWWMGGFALSPEGTQLMGSLTLQSSLGFRQADDGSSDPSSSRYQRLRLPADRGRVDG